MLNDWQETLSMVLDGWVAWTVLATSFLIYGLMTLTLRVSEPTGLSARLMLSSGQRGGGDAPDDVDTYRSMRMVLTSIRTASVISLVIAAILGVRELSVGELNVVTMLGIGVGILLGLIVMRAMLNRLADGCFEDVAIWLAPISWSARKIGTILPLRRLASYATDDQSNGEPLSEPTSNVLNVLHNIAAEDLRASDLMQPLAEVVAVKEQAGLGELSTMMINLDLDLIVVYGDSIDEVRGTVSKADVLQSLRQGSSEDTTSEGIISPVFALTTTQHVANVVDSFRGRTDHLAVVIAEDSKLEGILTYDRLMRKLLSNGDAHIPQSPQRSG